MIVQKSKWKLPLANLSGFTPLHIIKAVLSSIQVAKNLTTRPKKELSFNFRYCCLIFVVGNRNNMEVALRERETSLGQYRQMYATDIIWWKTFGKMQWQTQWCKMLVVRIAGTLHKRWMETLCVYVENNIHILVWNILSGRLSIKS